MTRTNAAILGIVLALALLLATATFEVVTYTSLQRTQGQLVAQSQEAAISQKASTQTRVQTVAQRCQLTDLILGVLVRVHDPVDAGPFQASEVTCLRQLKQVKAINAHTSTPRKRRGK